MSWGKPPDAPGMDAERTVRLFRVACAAALRHLDGVAKFDDALVALETAERRLAEFSVADVRALASGATPDARRVAAALVSLRDATDRASKKLDNWLAASKTKRMMGYDGNVRAALNELAVRAVDVADAAREHADDARESPDKLPNPLEVLAGTAFDDREPNPDPNPNLTPAPRRADGSPAGDGAAAPYLSNPQPSEPLSLAGLSLATDAPLSVPSRELGVPDAYKGPNAAADAKYTAALRAVAEGNAQFGVEFMCEAADAGHAAAAAQAAPALAEGRGCVRDLRRAARYYRIAAEAGDARALNEYGTMLLDGDEEATGVAQNLEAAARYFAAAGGRGSAAGDYNLAACHERGAGVPRDVQKAVTLYSRALSLGVFRAHLALGYVATAVGRFPDAADHFGAVLAANAAGELERVGLTAKDAADATFAMACVYERAAAMGRRRADDAESTGAAVAAVGRLRAGGGATGESEETARAAARAAAALDAARPETRSEATPDELRGDAIAAEAEARALVARAAEMGDARAARRRGADLWAEAEREREAKTGDEGKSKREEAIRWVVRAAADGIGEAWTWLGDVARDGKGGGKPDARLARRLYAEAMALEDAAGAARLAEMEEREWTEAKERGELGLLPTAPTLAWRPDV